MTEYETLNILDRSDDEVLILKALAELDKYSGENMKEVSLKLREIYAKKPIFIKSKIIRLLGKFKDKDSYDFIRNVKLNESPLIRESICDALGIFGEKEAIPFLLTMLEDDFSKVKGAAMGALGRLRTSEGIDKIVKLYFERDENYYEEYLKQKAEVTLIKIGPSTIKYLLENIKKTRKGFEKVFKAMGTEAFIPLKDAYEKSYDTEYKKKVFQALVATGDPRIKIMVSDAFNTEGLSRYAIKTLNYIDIEDLEDTLLELLNNTKFYEKDQIYRVLGKTTGSKEKFIETLMGKLKNKETSSVEIVGILENIVNLDVKEALDDVIDLLGYSGYKGAEIREAVVKALQNLDSERFKGKSYGEIYVLLPDSKKEKIYNSLLKQLSGETPILLAQLGQKRALEKIKDKIYDSNARVREANAAGLLAFLGKKYDVTDPLKNFSQAYNLVDDDLKKKIRDILFRNARYSDYGQEAAVKQLASLKGDNTIHYLIDLLDINSNSSNRMDDHKVKILTSLIAQKIKELDHYETEALLFRAMGEKGYYKSYYSALALSEIFPEYKGKDYSEIVNQLPNPIKTRVIKVLINSVMNSGEREQLLAVRKLAIIAGKSVENVFIEALFTADFELRSELQNILSNLNQITNRDINVKDYYAKLDLSVRKEIVIKNVIKNIAEYDYKKKRILENINEFYPPFKNKSFDELVGELPEEKIYLLNESILSPLQSPYYDSVSKVFETLQKLYNKEGSKSFEDVLSNLSIEQRERVVNHLIIRFPYTFSYIDYLVEIEDERIERVLIENFGQIYDRNQEKIALALGRINENYKDKSYIEIYKAFPKELQDKIAEIQLKIFKNPHDRMHATAQNALRVMSLLKNPIVSDELLVLLNTDSLSRICEIGQVLVEFKEKRAVDYLIKVLDIQSAGNMYDRDKETIILYLGKFGDKKVIEPFKQLIGSIYVQNFDEISKVLKILDSTFKYETIIDFLIDLSEEEREPYVKRFLDNFDSYQEKSGRADSEAQKILAMRILSTLKEKRAIPILKKHLNSREMDIRREAARTIGLINNLKVESFPEIINSLKETERKSIMDKFVSDLDFYQGDYYRGGFADKMHNFIKDIAEIHDERVFDLVKSFLNIDRRIYEIPLRYLTKIDTLKAIDVIISFLGDRRKEIREFLVNLLRKIDTKYKNKSFNEIFRTFTNQQKKVIIKQLQEGLDGKYRGIYSSREKGKLKDFISTLKSL
ncbi:hypothetical protein LCGC14_1064960 [marine sediment metagenome]|uniref:Clathrin/coatomer adaptor adaptin-like N-terminal domain-containing protein n=1 Tax=marine sediment metagenome TaxID=412755 RepID=A0A0F9MPQ1_9ZZZZ